MDIVIPYKNSISSGLELRYTLRGIEKYFPEPGNVLIIGDCPDFLQNVIHVSATDSPDRHHKALNIKNKLMLACNDKRVSDSFAWFSDDHFLLRPYVPDYNYRCQLHEAIIRFTPHQSYRAVLINTFRYLKDGYDYGHGPMVFDKEKFKRSIEGLNWSIPGGYVIKSLYCVLNGIAGEKYPDLKIKSWLTATHISLLLNGRPYFSIDDRGLNDDMKQVLELLYPNKSQFEK
jgi:hypothetical protein